MTEENQGVTFTKVLIRASSQEHLEREIEAYFKAYSPSGYSTRILKKTEFHGKWQAELSRYSSCD